MTWLEAIILGVVEGLTEYLPVSSTGHLILAQRAMGLEGDAANAYAICIQAGAILAVLSLYWGRTWQAIRGWAGKVGLGPGDPAGFRLGLNILVAFMPAAVIGLLFDEAIEAYLFGLWPIVFAWFVGGVAILVVARMRKQTETARDNLIAQGEEAGRKPATLDLDAMNWRMALIIGLIQCLAMWPGTSRSLVTIVGGVLVGLSLASAVEFSFLLGVVTLVAATVYKALLDSHTVGGEEMVMLLWMAQEYGWASMIVGSIAAWASAVIAVKWMVAYLKKHGLSVFGYYRVALAVIVAGLILMGVLQPVDAAVPADATGATPAPAVTD